MNTICSVCAMVGSFSSFGFYDPAQWELSLCLPWILGIVDYEPENRNLFPLYKNIAYFYLP